MVFFLRRSCRAQHLSLNTTFNFNHKNYKSVRKCAPPTLTKPVIYAGEDGLKRLTDVAFVKNNNKQTRLLLGNETPEQLRAMRFNPVLYNRIN